MLQLVKTVFKKKALLFFKHRILIIPTNVIRSFRLK